MTRPGVVRIIGGQWRSRQLKVPHLNHLRPTPNRVRETLFNWLSPIIQGAYCLDAFAGSGALGFEALSRGAAYVEMVDQAPEVVQLLQIELNLFAASNALVYQASVPEQLQKPAHPFDIVFLDPPFQTNLLLVTCNYLEKYHFLAECAYIYLEAQKIIAHNELPSNWRVMKYGRAGEVAFHLAKREKNSDRN